MSILIGIDDTDNKESRGTGFHSRQLAALLENEFQLHVLGITRHQQLLHPDVPYTSQNSSACIEVTDTDIEPLIKFCRQHLVDNQVPGCDIGLCVAPKDKISEEILSFAQSVKVVVVTKTLARQIASNNNVFLEGLCGTEDGVIGALSAIGLRKSGNDGRFIWLNGPVKELRDLPEGIMTISDMLKISGIHHAETADGITVNQEDRVLLNRWVRPILKNGNAVFIVNKSQKQDNYEWDTARKDIVRKLSD